MYNPIAQLVALPTSNTPQKMFFVSEYMGNEDLEPFRVSCLGGLLSTGERFCEFESLTEALTFASREVSITLSPH